MTDGAVYVTGARLAGLLARALQDADIEVISHMGGALTDARRRSTYSAGTVTLSAAGADALVRRLTGEAIGDRDSRHAVSTAMHTKRIGGTVTHDADTGDIGLASLTEGVVNDLIKAIA
jgi:hypothetical protein